MNKKNIYIYLFLSFFISINFIFAQEQQDNQQDNKQDVYQDLKKQDIEKLNDQKDIGFNQEQEVEKDSVYNFDFNMPTKMAQLLPSDCKQLVLTAWQSCNELIENSSDVSFLISTLCYKVSSEFNQYLTDNKLEPKDNYEVIETLEYLQNFLFSGQLDSALMFGIDKAIIDKLTELLEKVTKTKEIAISKYSQDFSLSLLESFLAALKNLDSKELIKLKIEYITPEIENSLITLNLALEKLKQIDSQDKDVKEAVDFWQTILQKFDYLKNGLDENGDFIQKKDSIVSPFFQKTIPFLVKSSPYIVGAYALYHNFFNLCKKDLGDKSLVKISFWDLLKFNFGDVFKINFNQNKHNKQLIAPLLIDKTLGFLILPILGLRGLQNKFTGEKSSDRLLLGKYFLWEFGYLCQVIIHYNSFHKWYFLKEGEKSENFWPADYKPFQKASWNFIKSSSDLLYRFIDYKINNNIDFDKLDKIEDYSLGLVRPELIKFFIDSALPLVTYKYLPKDIINFKREDLLKPDISDWYYVGLTSKTDIAKMSDKTYLRNRILGYASVSMGGFLGKKIALSNRENILKFLKYLTMKTGLIDKSFLDNLPEYKNLLVNEFKYLFMELDKENEPVFIAGKKIFLNMLVQLKLVSQLDCAKFEKTLLDNNADERELELFVDKILNRIVDGMVKQIGAAIGAYGFWHLANYYACNN